VTYPCFLNCRYVHLPAVLTEDELCAVIDPVRLPAQAQHPPARPSTPSCAPLARRQRALRSQREQVYDAFLARKIEVPGKDLCDMSGAKGRTPDDYSVYNVMLPRTYYPAWQGNIFEQRCQVHPLFHALSSARPAQRSFCACFLLVVPQCSSASASALRGRVAPALPSTPRTPTAVRRSKRRR